MVTRSCINNAFIKSGIVGKIPIWNVLYGLIRNKQFFIWISYGWLLDFGKSYWTVLNSVEPGRWVFTSGSKNRPLRSGAYSTWSSRSASSSFVFFLSQPLHWCIPLISVYFRLSDAHFEGKDRRRMPALPPNHFIALPEDPAKKKNSHLTTQKEVRTYQIRPSLQSPGVGERNFSSRDSPGADAGSPNIFHCSSSSTPDVGHHHGQGRQHVSSHTRDASLVSTPSCTGKKDMELSRTFKTIIANFHFFCFLFRTPMWAGSQIPPTVVAIPRWLCQIPRLRWTWLFQRRL